MKIGYDGTDYAGWQKQSTGLGIQQVLEDTIEKLFHEQVHVMGSGRTDAGVHARGQVAAMDLLHPIPAEKLLLALNANLPEDIRVYQVWEAAADFHPRFAAKRKTYAYRFINGPVMPPELRRYYTLIKEPLDMEQMRQALQKVVGEHDFAAFRSSGGVNMSTVRSVYRAELVQESEGWRMEITGNGFLYNMVRIIAGTAFEIAKGRLPANVISRAMVTGRRQLLGPTAPAKGLTLMNVEYEDRAGSRAVNDVDKWLEFEYFLEKELDKT